MRPVFLRGMRRHLVRYDLDLLEVVGVAFALILMLAIGVSMAFAAPRQVRACDAPEPHQVLVWSVDSAGTSTCQYVDRDRSS
jgi:hypothetical protein